MGKSKDSLLESLNRRLEIARHDGNTFLVKLLEEEKEYYNRKIKK